MSLKLHSFPTKRRWQSLAGLAIYILCSAGRSEPFFGAGEMIDDVRVGSIAAAQLAPGSAPQIVAGTGRDPSAVLVEGFLAYYEYPNSGPNLIDEADPLTSASYRVICADLNGDGFIDVVASDGFDIWWYKNNNSLPISFEEKRVETSANINSVFAIHVDGDSDVDLIASSSGSDSVFWYENSGGLLPNFSEHSVDQSLEGAAGVQAGDLDGDFDADFVAVSSNDGIVAWYENLGGSPPAFFRRDLPAPAASRVIAQDIDSDDDLDLTTNVGVWFENDGKEAPSFQERELPAAVIWICDLNGDGRQDVVLASNPSPSAGELLWAWNDGVSPPGFIVLPVSIEPYPILAAIAVDMNADGRPEILAGGTRQFGTDYSALKIYGNQIHSTVMSQAWVLYP